MNTSMAGTPVRRQPTIDDLRVKLCYICREEESYDNPVLPSRRWVHPCKCTLIAHEDCLLEWIRTAEQNPRKKEDQVLKCPQCGAQYEMVSEQTSMLRFMERGNRVLSISGRLVTVCTIGSVAVAIASGVYSTLLVYGSVAFRQFAGEELFQYLVTDNITDWPLMAWLDFPLIPISLILGRSSLSNLASYNHMFMLWPLVSSRVQLFPTSSRIAKLATSALVDLDDLQPDFSQVFLSWPPSPIMYSFGFSVVRALYNKSYRSMRKRILGESVVAEEQLRNGRGGGVRQLLIENWQMEVRVDEEVEDVEDAPVPLPVPRAENVAAHERQNEAAQAAADAPARVDGVLGLHGLGDAPVQGAGAEQIPGALPEDQRNEPVPNERLVNGAPEAIQENPDLRPRNANSRITGSVIGRVIGGALIIPYISSRIGNILLRLSHYSPLLRRFLGVRPPGNAQIVAALGVRVYDRTFSELMAPGTSIVRMIWLSVKFGVCLMGAGSAVWRKADPVWWRSTIGLGIYVITRDAISLYYQYLSQKEVRSRTLRDRTFEGIDPNELDLIPERRAEMT